jgi:hypothetical protein
MSSLTSALIQANVIGGCGERRGTFLLQRALICERGFRVPVFSYFLIVGSLLTGLLFFANSVMVAGPLPFSVSQTVGLPGSNKAPVVVAEDPTPAIIATPVQRPVEPKKLIKKVGKHKQTRVVRQVVPQGRYAAYPSREYGSLW